MQMKLALKKLLPAALVFVSLGAAAALISLGEVNKKLVAMTAPFNNASTAFEVKFTSLNVDAVHALDFGLYASLVKTGTANSLDFKINKADYHYGDGTAPTMTADLSLGLDLAKALGQNNLNQLADGLTQIVQSFTSSYTQKYGAAVTLDVAVDELQKDPQGNVQSARIHLNAAIDFSKLPNNLKAEDVEFKSAQVRMAVGLAGARAEMTVVMNPLNKSFQEGQPGLKEYIEKILSEDKETYDMLASAAQALDSIAQQIVDQKAP